MPPQGSFVKSHVGLFQCTHALLWLSPKFSSASLRRHTLSHHPAGPTPSFFCFCFCFLKFIYFWLRWVFVAAHRLPLVAARAGYSLLQCAGFSSWWLLLSRSVGCRCSGFSSCGMRAQQLWLVGLVAPQHVGSSQARAQTCVPCIGRRILNHCATREAPTPSF